MKRWTAVLGALLVVSLPASLAARDRGDMARFGEDIVIEKEDRAADVACFGCSITIRGEATGDVAAFGGNVTVEGSVGADLAVFGGNLRLAAGSRVGGDVAVIGGQLERHPDAEIGGRIKETAGLPFRGLGPLLLVGFLVLAAINLILVLVAYGIAGAPRVETTGRTVETNAGWALLAGVGTIVAAVVLYVVSAFLGPVTPILAIAVSLALVVTLVMGYTGLSWLLGRVVVRQKGGPLAKVFVGALLITLLQAVPFVGFLVFLAAVLLALGSAAFSGYGTSTDWLQRAFAGGFRPPPAAPGAPRT